MGNQVLDFAMPRSSRRTSSRQRSASPPRRPSQNELTAKPSQSLSQQGARNQVGESRGPGLFGQMASTAAGVAVGSTIGHTLGAGLTGLFSGSGSSNDQQVQQDYNNQQAPQNTYGEPMQPYQSQSSNMGSTVTPCDYYFNMLKACQAANSL